MMFNWTMLHYAGENGVAAVTIIMYVLMFASSLTRVILMVLRPCSAITTARRITKS